MAAASRAEREGPTSGCLAEHPGETCICCGALEGELEVRKSGAPVGAEDQLAPQAGLGLTARFGFTPRRRPETDRESPNHHFNARSVSGADVDIFRNLSKHAWERIDQKLGPEGRDITRAVVELSPPQEGAHEETIEHRRRVSGKGRVTVVRNAHTGLVTTVLIN